MVYKLLVKILVNKLKGHLNKAYKAGIIYFIHNRNIDDNIFIAIKFAHSMIRSV